MFEGETFRQEHTPSLGYSGTLKRYFGTKTGFLAMAAAITLNGSTNPGGMRC
jgi:hypothetical protein